ncbi:group III truncated hemoglobin [Riemerella anatipestifer]|uniref:group III truncated hemoglobin n=1 Tax=Riemerella anatipestifer TaxID=34085 RepID=UPI0012AE2A97|nr:group III truncated hemoglobin [Riemerella anatipestifer]MDY3345592.1 group III truncated hemoglobin [Riemerella anatipestifer]MDY3358672.1 group III truncated hemoglobin [Riemerella anatipestifer]USL94903.1 group III truncated hemoglobin [Riemerella anatipestifer]
MKALENRQDIETLVNRFYDKVGKDATIGFFFNEVAKVNWDEHLPKMYAFWETLLFSKVSYKGNPMGAHFPINDLVPMEKHHFEHWLKLWTETIDELYEGSMAETAKYKAANIANLMAYKMEMARR